MTEEDGNISTELSTGKENGTTQTVTELMTTNC